MNETKLNPISKSSAVFQELRINKEVSTSYSRKQMFDPRFILMKSSRAYWTKYWFLCTQYLSQATEWRTEILLRLHYYQIRMAQAKGGWVGTSQYIKGNVAQILHSLGQTVLLEVPVEVADPLDVDRHHAPRDGQLGVVTPGSRHHVSWDKIKITIQY